MTSCSRFIARDPISLAGIGLGAVAYVGNGLSDNAVVGLVTPLDGDLVFDFMGIAVSAFCEASVQAPPFVACGRAGNGLVVLEPKTPMSAGELAYFAAYINRGVKWRFSWYWQTTATRLARLEVPERPTRTFNFPVLEALPKVSIPEAKPGKPNMRRFALGSLFKLRPGDFHSVGHMPPGDTPMISCGDLDNGICGYVNAPGKVYRHKMTIAFNGSTLSAKYHPYTFAAKDDVAVCTPLRPLRLTTLFFIQIMLRREQWRFSYYRKCYREKLERVTVPLPATATGEVDEERIGTVLKATPYWSYLATRLHLGDSANAAGGLEPA